MIFFLGNILSSADESRGRDSTHINAIFNVQYCLERKQMPPTKIFVNDYFRC